MSEAAAASERSERGSAAAPSLVIHRERSLTGFCERPAKGVRWVFPDGRVMPVRCGASNKCWYCAMLSALENALVVRLDCLEGDSWPTWGLTTTNANPYLAQRELRRAERSLFQWLRRQYGRQIEYLGFVEFTTGRNDGRRRPHVHHLVKGLPRPSAELAARLEGQVSRKWYQYTGDSWVVECRPLRTPLGAIAYLALHHHKREQQPPKGWSGKRFRPSRGYFNRPVAELRAEARALISDQRIERALVAMLDPPDGFDSGILDELIYERIDWAREEAAKNAPTLVRTKDLPPEFRMAQNETPLWECRICGESSESGGVCGCDRRAAPGCACSGLRGPSG